MVSTRSVTVLGATGSIGQATLDVLEHQGDAVSVLSVVSGSDADALAKAARRMRAKSAIIYDGAKYLDLKNALSGTGIVAAAGEDAVIEAAMQPVDWTMGAISGIAGLKASYAALNRGGTLALATKECIVSAGDVFMAAAAKPGTSLLPVDSEHNAIFQALSGSPIETVRKITLTASGGPFRNWSRNRIAQASVSDALKHPVWSMGSKITIDSATMMNKGLELIEAHYLFGLGEEQIEIVVHPQSIIHGLVTYKDGSVLAGMAPADMRVAIAHTLGYPDRLKGVCKDLDLTEIGNLTFEPPNAELFPALQIARDALKHGNGAPTVLNAANELAVQAFLEGRIGFTEIVSISYETISCMIGKMNIGKVESLDDALELDRVSRLEAARRLPNRSGRSLMTALH